MADDTRERTTASAVTDGPRAPGPAAKSLSRGIVLGKDGKPCRSCTSFADFTSQTKRIARPSSTLSSASAAPVTPDLPPDCPPDVEALGRSSWTLLHAISASYPTHPTSADRSNISQFLSLFSKLYPCWICAEDFQDYMKRERVRTESRDEFGKWLCEAHNDVNRKLGKEEFDCTKWEERWRTGGKDGGCD